MNPKNLSTILHTTTTIQCQATPFKNQINLNVRKRTSKRYSEKLPKLIKNWTCGIYERKSPEKKFLKKHLEIKTSFKKSQFSVLGQNVTGNKVLSLHNWDLFSKKLTGIKALKKIYTKKKHQKSTKSCKNEVKTETCS